VVHPRPQLSRDPLGSVSDDEATTEKILKRKRKAAERMSVSYMSDAKWRKALGVLASTHPGGSCRWKFLRHQEPIEGSLPHSGEVDESHLDCSLLRVPFGVLPSYRDIEWLEVLCEITWQPYKKAPLSRRRLDLRPIRHALESAGAFEIEESADGLRVYGYRP
jgi:hypothetical protein